MQNSYTDNLRRILAEADDFAVIVEFYSENATPTADGFDPNTALKRFAAIGDLDVKNSPGFFGANYTRLVRNFGSFKKTISAEANSGSVEFDNLTREISALELGGADSYFEGKIKVVRLISRGQSLLLSDSYIVFVGRCEKPKSGNREKMSVSSRHILGSTETEIPRRRFSPEDAEGRHPSDPEFEGFRFAPQTGVVTYTTRERRGGLFGLLGFKKTVTHNLVYSSYSDIDATKYLPEACGRVQMIGTHLGYIDLGTHIRMLTSFCEGEILAYFNVRTVNSAFPLNPTAYEEKVGKVGLLNGAVNPNWPSAAIYSRTAHILSEARYARLDETEPAPDLAGGVLGRIVTVPGAGGGWVNLDWSDDAAAQTRFYLTDKNYYNLDPAWLDDASFLEVFKFNNEIIFDSSYSDTLFIPESFSSTVGGAQAMTQFLRSTAVCSPEFFRYLSKDKTPEETFLLAPNASPYDDSDSSIDPIEPGDGGGGDTGGGGGSPTSNLFFFLRRRYVSNFVVTEQQKLIDFFHKVLFQSSRLYFSQNAAGQIKLNSKKPVDYALATAALSGNVVALDDVSKWISDKSGQLLIDPHTPQSEVRAVTAANYSAAQNAVTLAASLNIGIVAGFGGGNGANTPAQATLRVSEVITENYFELDGVNIPFVAGDADNENSIAGFIYGAVNGHPTLSRRFRAAWVPGSPDVYIIAKFGTLTLDSNLQLLHTAPLANPTAAPTLAAASGGTLSAGVYKVGYAFANQRGQTLLSPVQTVTLAANQKISVSAMTTVPVGASVFWYCSPAANSNQLRFVKENNGAAFVISDLPKVTNSVAPDINRTGAEVLRVAQVFSDRAETRSNAGRSNVLKATFEWLPERRNPVNQVELTYRDSTQDFRLSRIILRDDAHIAKTKKISKLEINGQAIDSYHQAYRIASGELAENRDADFFYKWTADREALLLEEGSVVCITDDSSGVYNLPVRIEQIEISFDKNSFPKASFTARKYSTTLYDDSVAERQIPVIVETVSASEIAAYQDAYQYMPTHFDETRTFSAADATLDDTKNALATVMSDLQEKRK